MEAARKEDLSHGLWISLAVHLGILSLFMLKSVFHSSDDIALPPAIRVDIVGLPPKHQALPPPLTQKPESAKPPELTAPPAPPVTAPKPTVLPKKEVVKKDEINLHKTKVKQSDAFNKLKSLNAFDKIKKEISK